MPRSGIGKESGFTLIEVLAIIILIGFMAFLIFPSFSLGQEGTEIRFIGQLITSDIKQVKEEALFGKTESTIQFANDGYSFQIGETYINRNFQKYQFAFDMPVEEEEASEETGSENDAPTDGNGSPTVTTTPVAEDFGESDSVIEESESAVTFAEDGSVSALDLKWETTHYKGTLTVKEDGTVEWRYERK